MKTEQNQDKATARPWKLLGGQDNIEIVQPAHNGGPSKLVASLTESCFDESICKANAALIVEAVNQHSELLAVAEAGEVFLIARNGNSPFYSMDEAENKMMDALAALAAVRS